MTANTSSVHAINWRILVVDDEPDVRNVLERVLDKKYEVVTAGSGVEVLNGLNHIEPDFIILDVRMPDIDGFNVCRRIRSDSRFRETPVLFLSALSGDDDVKKGYEAGGNLYLTKPFDPIRLMKNIEVFIERMPPPYRRKRYTIDDLDLLDFSRKPKPTNGGRRQAAASARPKPAPTRAPTPVAPAADIEDIVYELPAEEPLEDDYDFGVSGAGAALEDKAPAARGGRSPRLLCVMDDTDGLLDVADAVGEEFEFIWANDGLTAYDRLRDYEPDIIMLEALVPKMSGFQLCQAIRRKTSFLHTPIVFYSARATARERKYATSSGANAFIQRPSPRDRIVKTLRQQMAKAGDAVRDKALTVDEVLDLIEGDETHAKARPAPLTKTKTRGGRLSPTSQLENFLRENADLEPDEV